MHITEHRGNARPQILVISYNRVESTTTTMYVCESTILIRTYNASNYLINSYS
ncbi:hypothetical protein LINPERPRIM_LOCUS37217, partial [Linum perenne]